MSPVHHRLAQPTAIAPPPFTLGFTMISLQCQVLLPYLAFSLYLKYCRKSLSVSVFHPKRQAPVDVINSGSTDV